MNNHYSGHTLVFLSFLYRELTFAMHCLASSSFENSKLADTS
jgi:hypothetical protein